MKTRYRSLQSLIPWQRWKRPIDWKMCFQRRAPLIVEIGFGNGEYLVRTAQRHPRSNFVGIEVEWESIQRGLRRLAQTQLSNVRFLLADSKMAFDRLFSEQSVNNIYSLFPCPWPKKRHTKRRLFSHLFLKTLNNRLVKKGELRIVTDDRDYADWILEQLPKACFDAKIQTTLPQFDTKYERKWRAEGQKRFFEIVFLKKQHLYAPAKEDIPLKTYRVKKFDPKRLLLKDLRGEITIQFKDFLYDPKRKKGMVSAIIVEENLLQKIWIEIVYAHKIWNLRPVSGGGIIPTAGVQLALDLIYQQATLGARFQTDLRKSRAT